MSNEAYKAADALGAAIKARSTEQLEKLYDDGIVVWHNTTGQGMGKAENIGLLRGIFAIASHMEYKDIRRYPIEGGLVQQHQLTGTFNDGVAMPSLDACMVIKVKDGRILRIDEYLNAATFDEVWRRLGDAQGL